MGDLYETVVIGPCRIFIERNWGAFRRVYFSAHIQLPTFEKIILDDRVLPRLKKTIFEVLRYRGF